MAITKTWKINTCVRETADGYLKKAFYSVEAIDGIYNARISGEVDLEKPDTLIPYADLTHNQVIGWVKAKIETIATAGNGLTATQIEANLDAEIEKQKTPSIAIGTPWS